MSAPEETWTPYQDLYAVACEAAKRSDTLDTQPDQVSEAEWNDSRLALRASHGLLPLAPQMKARLDRHGGAERSWRQHLEQARQECQ